MSLSSASMDEWQKKKCSWKQYLSLQNIFTEMIKKKWSSWSIGEISGMH